MSDVNDAPPPSRRGVTIAAVLVAVALIGAAALYLNRQQAQAAADAKARNSPRWQNYLKSTASADRDALAAFKLRQAQLAEKRRKQPGAKP